MEEQAVRMRSSRGGGLAHDLAGTRIHAQCRQQILITPY